MTARLVSAIISTLLEEVVLVVIWLWGLPQVGIELPIFVLIAAMVALAAYAVISFWIGSRALSRKAVVGMSALIGGRGKVVSPLAPEGLIRISSELWTAKSIEGNIDKGEGVTVVGLDGLKLIVRKGSSNKS